LTEQDIPIKNRNRVVAVKVVTFESPAFAGEFGGLSEAECPERYKAPVTTNHGPCKIPFASATRLSSDSGPVAFRPTITRGLALSTIQFQIA
jgi:hypothetical protein